MEEWVRQAFFANIFFQTMNQGEYNLNQVRYFAVQYGHYSRNFPRVLGAAISAMAPSPEWWIPLADNLWDEAGRGVSGRSHADLYHTFIASVFADRSAASTKMLDLPISPAVFTAVDTFIAFFRSASPLEAMAAVGLGSELFAGTVMGYLGQALAHPRYQTQGPLNRTFWSVHAEVDEPRHYQLCRNILASAEDPASLQMFWDVGRSIAGSEAQMYVDLHREMRAFG